MQVPWLAARSGNPCSGFTTGGGTGGGGRFLSLDESFEKVTNVDVFGCLSNQSKEVGLIFRHHKMLHLLMWFMWKKDTRHTHMHTYI